MKINLTCSGCTNFTEAYLMRSTAGVCDLTSSSGSKEGTEFNTNSSAIQFYYKPDGSFAKYTFPFDLGSQQPGYDYRLCIDLHVNSTTFFYGDVGYLVYVTPVTEADLSVIVGPGGYESTSFRFTCASCVAGEVAGLLASDCNAEG